MLTNKQQVIKDRRDAVGKAYTEKPEQDAVTTLVEKLAKKYNVTQVTIYGDLKILGLTGDGRKA